MTKKRLTHILPWCLFSAFILFTQRGLHPEVPQHLYFFIQLLLISQTLLIFYLNYLYFVPKLLIYERKIPTFLFSVLVSILLGIILSAIIRFIFHRIDAAVFRMEFDSEMLIGNTFTAVFFVIMAIGIRIIVQYNRDRIKKVEMKTIIQRAELDALKAQLNPHFLYNAFNTIYALAETKSDLTSKAILQLSEITRYVTYKSCLQKVPLSEELHFIRNYIEFQQLRIESPESKVIVQIADPHEDFMISPLLLLPFAENAFKHSNLLKKDVQIRIQFTPKREGFDYYVSNEIFVNTSSESGIGLQTLKKILEFNYANNHTVKIWTEKNIHHAQLTLSTKNND